MNVDWNISKSLSQEKRNDVDFLNHRFSIFEKTCYPSVINQNHKKFIWIILVDSDLPNQFREKIKKYSNQTEVEIITLDIVDKNTFLPTLKQTIINYLSDSPEDLITSNVDSDDVISRNFISSFQNQFRRQLNHQISLFSETEFNVEADLGLQGYCDFLLSFSSEQYFITAPVITIVEAKNENIMRGLGQCVASMVGAQLFNQRSGNPVKVIYGAVTTGTNWKFLTLEEKIVRIDAGEYYIKEVDKILGIILQPFRECLV